MGYWQDVLAENPGILKPTLNNTGPFRRFLHTAFLDNTPIDRFVDRAGPDGRERPRRRPGRVRDGASQNDAPMAAKAHVLAKAFLAAEMKCARCHDAPFHPYDQDDLFGLAGLLAGKPQAIPGDQHRAPARRAAGCRRSRSSLEAGEAVEPAWNLTDDRAGRARPKGSCPRRRRSRERLAALITSPTNQRFAPVLVNRLWHRYLGDGLVEPVDDWDDSPTTRNPELLADLARELIAHDYDLKHVARLIFHSRAYQARVRPAGRRERADAAASRRGGGCRPSRCSIRCSRPSASRSAPRS